jgi:hypothetical protein
LQIKVKDLRPNPFRNLDRYPIDREKIDNLKISINKTGFWDNVLVRPHPTEEGAYELAYGHHRYQALQEIKIDVIDAPVKMLTDVQMIQIMADENYEYGAKNPKIVNETVASAKKYIEDEINGKNAVYDDLEQWCKDLFDGEDGFKQSMRNFRVGQEYHPYRVGRSTIQRFLGSNWGEQSIKYALKVLEAEASVKQVQYNEDTGEETTKKVLVPISREAAEEFEVVGQSRAFVETVTRDPDCRTAFPTAESQLEVAKMVKAEDEPISGPMIKKTLVKIAQDKKKEATENVSPDQAYVNEIIRLRNTFNPKVRPLMREMHNVHKKIKELPDYTKQPVLTEKMIKAILNDMFEAEHLLQKYREELTEQSGVEVDEDCIDYNCFETSKPYTEDKKKGSIVKDDDDNDANTEYYTEEDYILPIEEDEEYVISGNVEMIDLSEDAFYDSVGVGYDEDWLKDMVTVTSDEND